MSRTTLFIASLTAAMAMPALASAHCGTKQGSFIVTCEKGVKVYRHDALSSIPQGPSIAEARLEAAKERQKTARLRISAAANSQAASNKLRQRALDIKEYRARVYDRNTRRRSYSYGGYGYGGGLSFARPIRVRSKH